MNEMRMSKELQTKIEKTIQEMSARSQDTMDVINAGLFFISTNPEQLGSAFPVSQIEWDGKIFYLFQKGH